MGVPVLRPIQGPLSGPSRRVSLLACTGCLLWMGCGGDEAPSDPGARSPPTAAQATGTVADATGRKFSLDNPPARIVSLVPSATETLLALGARDRLVGRTDFDTASALADLPTVGGGLGPSVEALVSLEPDLVIRFAGQADVRTPARLDALGIPHFAVRPDRVEDVRGIIRDLGRVTGRERAAATVLAAIDQRLDRVRDRVEGLPRIRTAFLLDGTPPWAAGPRSYIGELIVLGGGHNVFNDLVEEYAPVSPEELVARDMAVVLTVRGAAPAGVPAGVEVRPVSPVTQLPGPGLGEAAEEIARALHPEAFR